MAVSSYISETGDVLYKVYVNVRSQRVPSLRAQRKLGSIKTEKEAEREELRLTRECEREILEKEMQGSSWGTLVDAWERQLETEKDQSVAFSTRTDYIAALRKHTWCWWKRAAVNINRADVKEVLGLMHTSGASMSYINKMKVIINRVFVFGIEYRLVHGIDRSPTIGITFKRTEEKKPEILTIGEIRRLLSEARQLNHPWYCIWAVALLTGMRNGELYALTWMDIDWENKMLSVTKSYNTRMRAVKSTKSGEYRGVPLSPELLALLQEVKATAGKRTHVLPRIAGWEKGMQAKELRKFCLGIGLPSVKFHTLRACFATQLIRNGVPPIQIQKICGWKDLETMQRYIRLAGIEIEGATNTLKVLPEAQVMAQVVNMFTKEPVA